jgi:hypothetical protein
VVRLPAPALSCLMNGPNQGRGQTYCPVGQRPPLLDRVFLANQPSTAALVADWVARRRAPANAEAIASRNSEPRRIMPVMFQQRLRRGHHAAQRRRQLGVSQLALLSRLSGLRLGNPGRLGVGRLEDRRLSRDGSRDRPGEADRHGSVAQREGGHGRGRGLPSPYVRGETRSERGRFFTRVM